jgi:ATP-binding cassette, subfamily B, bacterial CvaB/MchF/RaxB
MAIINLSGGRRLPLIRQAEAAECGLACLAMISAFYGREVGLASIRRRFALSMKGMTLRTLVEVANATGFGARPVRCDPEELQDLRLPAILHWGTNHYVVLEKVSRGRLIVADPAQGRLVLPVSYADSMFTGIALELTPNTSFQRTRERNPLKLGSLLSLANGVGKALVQTIVLSLFVELMFLITPFYLQLVIDQALLKSDSALLTVLAISFSLVLLFRVIAGGLRGLTSQFVSSVAALEMKQRIFSHLIRLPLDWFQKRQVGDVQSRFWAIRAIQSFVAQGALTGILDGLLGSLVLILMFFYSSALAAAVLASMIVYTFVRACSFQISKRYAAESIITDAREQTKFLETLRAAQTVKAAGAENLREMQYGNAAAATVNAQIKSGNVTIGYTAAEQLVNGLTDIVVVYIGAKSVMGGDLSVGMLTAFLAYKGQFVTRMTNMIEQGFAWRLLDLQLERLADVVLNPKEERIDGGGFDGEIDGSIICSNLAFRYAFGEAFVLAGLSLSIRSGECVAIVGASGCGKSTLAKLIVGLYSPTVGQVAIDGRPLTHWSNRSLRAQISYISQDDMLLSGSIAENVAGFPDEIDMPLVRECARIAHIDAEIEAMPMAYESLVGDLGSSLSGGQKQRLLIARALYRKPRILVLDEATAHLDVENEKVIADALAKLTITRVVIAHRPETIARADRILMLRPDGKCVELDRNTTSTTSARADRHFEGSSSIAQAPSA